MSGDDIKKAAIRERKTQEKRQRIESIIASAKRVFFSKGYIQATMDEIALGAKISKPTIYQYFKNKDDLFFSLMIPVVEDIRKELEKIEKRLNEGKYTSGDPLLRDLFKAFYHSYEVSPDTFRIVQLFQQTGLMAEFDPDVRAALNDKGRQNFDLGRHIMQQGMRRGFIRKVDSYSLADLMWGLTVGVIQLEDIKDDDKQKNKFKKSALSLAEDIFIRALSK